MLYERLLFIHSCFFSSCSSMLVSEKALYGFFEWIRMSVFLSYLSSCRQHTRLYIHDTRTTLAKNHIGNDPDLKRDGYAISTKYSINTDTFSVLQFHLTTSDLTAETTFLMEGKLTDL